jgi:hypothetical protein
LANLYVEWKAARDRVKNAASGGSVLTEAETFEIVSEFYHGEMAADDLWRTQVPTEADLEAARKKLISETRGIDLGELEGKELEFASMNLSLGYLRLRDSATMDIDRRRRPLAALRKHSAGETALVSWAAEAAIRQRRVPIQRESSDFRRFCLALLRAWIEVLDRAAERDKGAGRADQVIPRCPPLSRPRQRVIFGHYRRNSVLSLQTTSPSSNSSRGMPQRNLRNIKTDTINQSRKIIEHFVESLPEPRFLARRITKKEVREWKSLLQRFPTARFPYFRWWEALREARLPATIRAPTENSYWMLRAATVMKLRRRECEE